jgi:endoglucanase
VKRLLLSVAAWSALVPGCIPKDTAATPASGSMGAGGPSAPPPPGGNLLKASTFEDGKSLPWTSSFTTPAAGDAVVEQGAYCLNVRNKGKDVWDAQVRHREMTIQKGHQYQVRFTARASVPTKVRPKIGQAGPPYHEYWHDTIDLGPEPKVFSGSFQMNADDDPTAELAFHAGGSLAPDGAYSVCLDDVYLTDSDFTPAAAEKPMALPAVRVNQVGYLPKHRKTATALSTSAAPFDFSVVNADGKALFQGKSKPFGADADSGDKVQLLDFSDIKEPGTGLVVKTGDGASFPFDVRPDIYETLRRDALAYFYQNRSGIPIEMPYAREEKWARPAGHLGDRSIPCAPGSGCSYSLDVSGGWYDAGDHGKYVVNGGIAAWTLLDEYERAVHLGSAKGLADGTLEIPERKNGVPDILDEARWELEFMLRMQVPEGKPLAGMVHHKIHDEKWTALGIAPHDAEKQMKRYLKPPSTAATLNLAAVAAQGARLFQPFDAAFASRCGAAATRAWAAAKKNPAVYAPKNDSLGGGPYDDTDVSDEMYWAAAELYITTGEKEYEDFVLASPHHKSIDESLGGDAAGVATAMTWQHTAALGTISLAVVPSHLAKAAMTAEQGKIVKLADKYLSFIDAQGYRVPMKAGSSGYPWGSNSVVLNNLIVLSLAFDFSHNARYLEGAAEGMDYILGRNPLAKSFVTGYGENPLQNPHHRFWSHQANAAFPTAPPGAVSGGPNSGLQDPYVQAAGLKGCAPQKCFADNIEAWSTNEIAINWNAPLAWVAAFLDEKGR